MNEQTFNEEQLVFEAGIEGTDDSENVIVEPFSPDSISMDQKSVPMDTLIRRLKQQTITLDPSFQRNEVWDDRRRSRLIESIMLKIPLPMFYVASDEDGRWEVVDGLQRLSTIRNFIFGDNEGAPLVLKDLEFLGGALDGKTFKDIEEDPTQQRLLNTIMETAMQFTVINPGTPESVKRNIFKRINTGGLPLTSQEIRHALYQGPVTDLLIELVASKEFKDAIGFNINDSRMGMRELIMYFLAFLVFPRSAYKGNVDRWLSNAMRVINLMPNLNNKDLLKIFDDDQIPEIRYLTIDALRDKFLLGMVRAKQLFGDHAFRKSLLNSSRKTPINKALFEVLSTALCELDDESFIRLCDDKETFFGYYEKIIVELSSLDIELALSLLEISNEEKAIYFAMKNDVLELDSIVRNFPSLNNKKHKQLTLINSGKFFNNFISRKPSEVESIQKRFNLVEKVINFTLEDSL